jgi:hypothetical protein
LVDPPLFKTAALMENRRLPLSLSIEARREAPIRDDKRRAR